jgi:CheY-like chemotaxis protein
MGDKVNPQIASRILVIEDEVEIRDFLELLLTREGYEVTTAADGAEALALLAAPPRPAVILLDLMMPRMDGRTCLEALSSEPALATIPVVVLSANPYPIPRGARAALVKPCRTEDLLSTLAHIVAGERRANPRFAAQLHLVAHDGTSETHAQTLNVSRGGVLFRSPACAKEGQSLLLTLSIDHKQVMIESEVRHACLELGGWNIGARFINIRAGLDALDRMLRKMEDGS